MFTAIFGGTFNPLHIGHYEMLAALQKREDIGKIWLMPDRIPPHKVCDFLAKDQDRIAMCRETARDFSKAELCLVEFERQGKSYTYDTVTLLKRRYPKEHFLFVCGGDMLLSFASWHRYRELAVLLPFLVFRRKGDNAALFEQKLATFRALGMQIMVDSTEIPAISSTEIRNNPQNSKDVLPEMVYDYIMKKGIYRG